MIRQYIETGKITGLHGVRGEMRVQPWCDAPADLARLRVLYLDPEGRQPLAVERARVHKTMVIVKARGIDAPEQAAALRDRVVYLNRDELSLAPGQYLVADLLGCRVEHAETGEVLGELTDVTKTGANDVWEVTQNGRAYLLPAIPDVVRTVEVAAGLVKVVPLKGIFDDDDAH